MIYVIDNAAYTFASEDDTVSGIAVNDILDLRGFETVL